MISTINISNTLRKLSSADAVAYFMPAFELLDFMPEHGTVEDVANMLCTNLPPQMAGELLSSLLTIEGGTEDEIEGVEFTTDEINDAVALFHDICERFPEIMELAQNL
jgi:hypothetical protein